MEHISLIELYTIGNSFNCYWSLFISSKSIIIRFQMDKRNSYNVSISNKLTVFTTDIIFNILVRCIKRINQRTQINLPDMESVIKQQLIIVCHCNANNRLFRNFYFYYFAIFSVIRNNEQFY